MTIIDDLLSIVSGKPVKGSVLDIFGKPQPPKWVVLVDRRRGRPPATANDTGRRDLHRRGSALG
jgi:hypothetical protein